MLLYSVPFDIIRQLMPIMRRMRGEAERHPPKYFTVVYFGSRIGTQDEESGISRSERSTRVKDFQKKVVIASPPKTRY
jgi:hypothetical protein